MDSPTCPEGGDSPLSTTGNVLGILTFAIGLFFFIVSFAKITKGADAEIARFKQTKDHGIAHVENVKQQIKTLWAGANPGYLDMKTQIDQAVAEVDCALRNMDELWKRFTGEVHVWTRVNWWFAQEEVQACRTQLASAQQSLIATLFILLLKSDITQGRQTQYLFQQATGPATLARYT